jgi:putative DNA primase/helicase
MDKGIGEAKREERPAEALVGSNEDGEETVKARLGAAGADIRFVDVREGLSLSLEKQEEELQKMALAPVRPSLLRRILSMVKDSRVGLVVLDPLPVYMGRMSGGTDAGTVRRCLEPLLDVAERYGIAVVGVTHMKKEEGCDVLDRIMGSRAFTALARSVLLVERDGEERDRRVVVPLKSSFGPVECAYRFWIREWKEEGQPGVAYVEWEDGGIKHGLVEQCAVETPADEGMWGQREAAKAFLREMVANGPCESVRLNKEAREVGISLRTLSRAKAELGMRSWREKEKWMVGKGGLRTEC